MLIPWQPGGDQTAGVRGAVVDSFCVFTLPDGHPIVDEVLARDLPAVFVDGPAVPGRPFVGIDDRAAMAEVMRHLVNLGHRSVGVLSCRFHYDRSGGAASTDAAANATFRVSSNTGRRRCHPLGSSTYCSLPQAGEEKVIRSPRPASSGPLAPRAPVPSPREAPVPSPREAGRGLGRGVSVLPARASRHYWRPRLANRSILVELTARSRCARSSGRSPIARYN